MRGGSGGEGILLRNSFRGLVTPLRHNMPRPLQALGDMNSYSELSGWRSPRMSLMWIIVLHPYTKLEVRRPSRSGDMADFR